MRSQAFQQTSLNYGKGLKGVAAPESPPRKGFEDGVCALCQDSMEGEEAQGLLVRMYCNNNRFCDECKLHHTCVEGYLKSLKLHVQKRNGFDCPQPGCNGRVDRWSVIKGGSAAPPAAAAAPPAARAAAAPQAKKHTLPAGAAPSKIKPSRTVNLPPPPEPLPVMQGQVRRPVAPTGIPGAELVDVVPKKRKKAKPKATGDVEEGAHSSGGGAAADGSTRKGSSMGQLGTWESSMAKLQHGMTAEQYRALLGFDHVTSDDEYEEEGEEEEEEGGSAVGAEHGGEGERVQEGQQGSPRDEPNGVPGRVGLEGGQQQFASTTVGGVAPVTAGAVQPAVQLVVQSAAQPRMSDYGAPAPAGIAHQAPHGLNAQLDLIRVAAVPTTAYPLMSYNTGVAPLLATTPLVPQPVAAYNPLAIPAAGANPNAGAAHFVPQGEAFGITGLTAGFAFTQPAPPAFNLQSFAPAPPTTAAVGAATGPVHALHLLQQMQFGRAAPVTATAPAATAATATASAAAATAPAATAIASSAEDGEVEVDDLMALLGV